MTTLQIGGNKLKRIENIVSLWRFFLIFCSIEIECECWKKITFQTFRIVFVHHLSFVLGNAAPRSVMSTSPNLIEDGQKPNSLFGCGIQIILTFNLLFIWMIFLLDSRKFNLVLTAAAFKKSMNGKWSKRGFAAL